jgi:hypothetical protein
MKRTIAVIIALFMTLAALAIVAVAAFVWRTEFAHPPVAPPVEPMVQAPERVPAAAPPAVERAAAPQQQPKAGFIELELERVVRTKDGAIRISALRGTMDRFEFQSFEPEVSPFGPEDRFKMFILMEPAADGQTQSPRLLLVFFRRRLVGVLHSRSFRPTARSPFPMQQGLALTWIGRMKKEKRLRIRAYIEYLIETYG